MIERCERSTYCVCRQSVGRVITQYFNLLCLSTISRRGDNIRKWLASVKTKKGINLKALRSDNGGEYTSNEFRIFGESRGIRREYAGPYTPVQNGVVERMNRTIHDRVVFMLHHANLPHGFWDKADQIIVHVINLSRSIAKGLKVA